MVAQRLEVGFLDHERLPMLLQEDPHFRHRRGIPQEQRIGDHLYEVEVLNRLQRAPDLFPGSRQVGAVQHVHQGALQTGDAHAEPSAFSRVDPQYAWPWALSFLGNGTP